jgi:hypothetical protein
VTARPTNGSRRTALGFPLAFAIIGLVVALAAGALYLYRDRGESTRLNETRTVHEFLTAVFLAGTPDRVAPYVCASWPPGDAITRTVAEVGTGVGVSWDEIRVITTREERANVSARLGLRSADDVRPGSFEQWRFSLVDEEGWRVCDARPFVA